MRALFRVKPLSQLLGDTERPEQQLRRSLGPVQLTSLGIGAIVGAGIFSSVGTAAAGGAGHVGAGPALVVSLLLVAVACGFAALCYAELAAMVPVSGSAYTYTYATLGELAAWLIGWDLIIEYGVGNVAVAISWSAYFQELLRGLGLEFPAWLGTDFRSAWQAAEQVARIQAAQTDVVTLSASVLHNAQALADAPRLLGLPILLFEFPAWLGTDFRSAWQAAEQVAQIQATQTDVVTLSASVLHNAQAYADAPRLFGLPILFNLPAFCIVGVVTWVLVLGIRESAAFNTTLVVLKLAVIGFFLVLGALYVKPENWSPFAPNGWAGISSAAAIIFFAYIGFDAVSTAAEEARNPQRDMPISILASLGICTVLYVAVAIVLTGLAPWKQLGVADPLAAVFPALGLNWVAGVISVGALLATTSVLIPFQVGQPRIFFSMARDGLLPSWAAKVHSRYRTPHLTTILTGVCVASLAAMTNLNEMVELTNIGTLFAFILVAVGVLVLRRTHPDQRRSFRTPLMPWVPLGAVVSCAYLMYQLPRVTWIRFGVWMAIGLVIYFCYSRHRSRLHG